MSGERGQQSPNLTLKEIFQAQMAGLAIGLGVPAAKIFLGEEGVKAVFDRADELLPESAKPTKQPVGRPR